MADFNLGTVTAYGYAKDKGYTGTEDEFAELMASYAQVAEDAAESAEQAAQSATTATTKAGEAATSATNAANANTAAQAAKTGAETAAQTATTKADEASGSAATATTKAAESATSATNAAQSATTATTKAGEATTSATNAAASASAAAGSAQTAQDVADSIPADYTQLSDDVSSLKEDLTQIDEQIYSVGESKSIYASSNGWRLNESDGLCTENENYRLVKYAVTAGEVLYILSDDRFQFQTGVSVPSWGASTKIGDTYTRSGLYTVPSGTDLYLIISSTVNGSYDCKNIVKIIPQLSADVEDLNDTYDTKKTIIPNTVITGSYINTNGSVVTNGAFEYKQAIIDNNLVGKKIKVTGTGWYTIVPYVFVATSGATFYPSVSPGSVVTQYTDLSFTPQTTGTLYVNRNTTSSPSQIGEAYYNEISNIKPEYITSIDGVKDAVSYKVIPLEMTSGKLLNGDTGAITDNSGDAQRVSQYVEVQENTDYLITTEMFWSNGLYAWYDNDKNYISGVKSQSGGTVTKIYCQKVRSPKNAAYLVIGYLYQAVLPFPFLMEGEMQSILPSKRWSGKKWACIGDSLTEAYSKAGAHYFDLISAITGINAINMGVSGTGYARGTDNFMTRALTVPTDSDVVTFFGSGNDSGAGLDLGTASDTGTTTLGGCINTAIDNLYSIMPVVQLGIITPTPWQGNMPSDNGWMASYSNLIVEICQRRSIPCLDLFHCANLNPNSAEVRAIAYARDDGGGVHPSEAGHAIIAPRIQAFLETLLLH